MNALALAVVHTRIALHTRTQGTMKFRTEASPLARLCLIAFLVVGLTAVHAAFLLYRLYRSEEGPPRRCRDLGNRGRGACA
ncbi:MAG: hypothetical protein H0U97_10965 [Gammaproteobacteria bacterium]|nr:hypothetical protein [Gammaproteobacteria bacterium]